MFQHRRLEQHPIGISRKAGIGKQLVDQPLQLPNS